MALSFNSIPTKRLAATIDSSASLLKLNNILDWNGDDLTSAVLGDKMYAVLRTTVNNSTSLEIEIMELDPTTIASNSTTGITILKRGLKFNGDLSTEVSGYKKTWIKNQTVVEIGTDVPQIFKTMVNLYDDQTIAGQKTFSSIPISTGGTPTISTQLADKAYVDMTATGSATYDQEIIAGIAGETLAAGNLVYFKTADGRWWLTDADTSSTVNNVILGFAQGTATAGNAVNILLSGLDKNQSGLTAGTTYYAGNTAGAISSSAGTFPKAIGKAVTTTQILLDPNFTYIPTAGEKSAMAGDNTDVAVGTGNKFVTQTGFQHAAEVFAVDESASSTAYTATLSPAPTSLTNGMTVRVKIGLANTTTTPTLNVNGLGAKTIVKGVTTALVAGDISAAQYCTFIYDTTNTVWVLQNPTSRSVTGTTYTSGTSTKDASDASTTQTFAHGLGVTPKKVVITATCGTGGGSSSGLPYFARTVYNGSTQSSQSTYLTTVAVSNSTFTLCKSGSGATDGQAGVVTFDDTNITVTWTKTGTPAGVYQLVWEAEV